MEVVLITAAGVGGATVIGAALGFIFKKTSHKFNDTILGFAAGVMLAAAVLGLIVPSVEHGGDFAIPITVAGVIAGALFLNVIDRFVPHMHKLAGVDKEKHAGNKDRLNKTFLFVMAVAIHNIPEGLAAGVSFGTGNLSDAFTVAGGIALQNIPEGMVIIAPMLAAGISKKRTFMLALMTGLVEVAGTIVGYYAVNVAQFILPFALAFAGGTMLYIISDEMIPETHAHGFQRMATYALLIGFCVMLTMDFYMG